MSLLIEAQQDTIFSDRVRQAIAEIQDRQSRLGMAFVPFKFAGLILGIRVQTGGVTAALPAMIAHRRVANQPAMALIDVIEGPNAALESLLPPPAPDSDKFVLSSPAAYCLWEPHGSKLTLVDRVNGCGLVWYRAPTRLNSWDAARPMLHVFKGLSPVTQLMPVHAAAVAFGDHGILITGPSGAGKTSLALACVEAGWRYVGDDVVLLAGPPLRAVNLYRSARVREDMFPRLRMTMEAMVTLSTDSGEVKGEVDMAGLPASVIGDAMIEAIVVPRRAGAAAVSILPMRRSVALRELATTTLVTLPGDPAATYAEMARAMDQTPCHSIDPGPDLAAAPAALQRLLHDRRMQRCT